MFAEIGRTGKANRGYVPVKININYLSLVLACLLLITVTAGCSKNEVEPADENTLAEEEVTDNNDGPREGVYAD